MSKYSPLEEFLRSQRTALVPMTFAEIESVIGAPLPPSARVHRPWWSNNPKNSVITNAWLKAGFRTEQVNMEQGKLTFRRVDERGPQALSFEMPHSPAGRAGRHPLFGALKGLIRIAHGTDLTQPADPDWGKDN